MISRSSLCRTSMLARILAISLVLVSWIGWMSSYRFDGIRSVEAGHHAIVARSSHGGFLLGFLESADALDDPGGGSIHISRSSKHGFTAGAGAYGMEGGSADCDFQFWKCSPSVNHWYMAPSKVSDGYGIGLEQWDVRVPYWLIALITIILAIGVFILTRARKPGTCQKCGYDLRAHKPGDRCPECGTIIPAETKCGNV